MGIADMMERDELKRYALQFIESTDQKEEFVKFVLGIVEAELRRRLGKTEDED